MIKDSPDYKKRLVSIKGARVAPSSTKGNMVTLGGKASNAAELNLATKFANGVNGVKSVKYRMSIESSESKTEETV
jgi:hypothetical protein